MANPYGKVELVRYGQDDPDNSEWFVCQLAVDGRLSVPFSIHKADWLSYPNEEQRIQMLTRQAIGLLDQYGDARGGVYTRAEA